VPGARRGLTRFAYPTGYHYDALRAADFLRDASTSPDERIAEAVELIRQRRGPDGRWPLEMPDANLLDFDMDERDGGPRRWNTFQPARAVAASLHRERDTRDSA
jgi:hypothetical protein